MEAAQTAIGRAQALLDPTGQGLFSATRLMPYLNIAYSALRDEGVAQREVTAAEAVVILPNVAAYTADLGSYVAPAGVLSNLAAPLRLREKPAGSDDNNYTEVARVEALPDRTPDDRNRVYEWRGGNLYLPGAQQALDLEVRFEQLWPVLTGPGDALAAIGVATILGYWTAGLMATAMREQELGQQYIAEARHLLFRWVQRQVLDSQTITRRPRPYNAAADRCRSL
ncbi:MAG TPA: hypothetical protein VN515_02950 [Terriglobales bacterium]|nr:hypothetical protein [Terriglobales bacterium]